MQVTVESLAGLERRIKIAVPAERVDQEVESRLKKLVGEVRIDGFRPGKVPVSVVRQRYSNSVRGEVIGEVIRTTYMDAIEKEHLHPAGDPQMELTASEIGQPLAYTATFEIYPQIELKEASAVNLEIFQSDVTEADVDAMIEKLRKQQAEWADIERSAQAGDRLIIDFEGYIDDQLFEGGSAQEVGLEIGSNTMIPGFEQGLIGAKVGDTVTLDLRFPKDYHAEKFADKAAKFVVKVKKALAAKLPEIDDALAEKFGLKEGGIAKLRTEIKTNMERELKQVLHTRSKEQLLEKFLALHAIELPKVLVKREVEHMQGQAKEQYRSQTGSKEAPDFPADRFIDGAQRRVGLGLLFSEFIAANNIKADEQRVNKMIEEMAAVYQHPEQVVAWYHHNKEQLERIRSLAMEEQVVDKLMEQAQIVHKTVSYDEVMNPQTQG